MENKVTFLTRNGPRLLSSCQVWFRHELDMYSYHGLSLKIELSLTKLTGKLIIAHVMSVFLDFDFDSVS